MTHAPANVRVGPRDTPEIGRFGPCTSVLLSNLETTFFIFLLVAGDGTHLKLGDLGLGRQFGSRTLETNSVVGTPYYMAPEVAQVSLPLFF